MRKKSSCLLCMALSLLAEAVGGWMLLWYENMIVVLCVYVLIGLCCGDDKVDESKIMKKKLLIKWW